MARRVLTLALLGATFGTLLDWAHLRTGAIGYPRPAFFGLAWWVPLLYTGASLGIGLSHPVADRLLGRRARFPHTPLRLAAGFVALIGVWFVSGALCDRGSAVVSAVIAPASLGVWYGLDRTGVGLALALATALIGCGVEVILSRAGLFYHTHPDVLGVAAWLPWIYVTASVGLGNVGRWLAEREAEIRPPSPRGPRAP